MLHEQGTVNVAALSILRFLLLEEIGLPVISHVVTEYTFPALCIVLVPLAHSIITKT